jgi:transcriptional regulator with XRE-family HTH domain
MSTISAVVASYTEAAIERLAAEREAQGLTFAALAQRARLSRDTVRRTLTGQRNNRFSTEDQGRLSVALGLNPFTLIASPDVTVQQIRTTADVALEMGAL